MLHHKKVIIYNLAIMITFVVKADNNNCPSFCKCDMLNGLRSTKCVNQRLTSLEADIPSKVQFLDLSYNEIATIPDYGFKDLNIIQLVVVNISSNMLHTIGLRAFFNLNQLQTVNLSNNLLHTLAPDLFEYNQRLKQLILAGNKYVLSQQLSNTFLESNSLQVLDMSKCFISHLYPNIFLQLPNLTTLDISNNLLIELKASVIENLTKLKHLKLSKNLWICNNKMAELKLYLNHKHIIYENPCETLEKSQKIVLLDDENQEDGDEGTVNWLYNDANIDRPNEDIHRTNQTKYTSTTINKTFLDSTLLLIMIAFSVGFVFGIFVTCFSVNILSITKRVKRNRPKPELSEFILNDIPYGMSTPVLNRVQRYT